MNVDYDPIEKLSLLSPHAVDWRHIPSDFQRLTASDIAARLAKLNRGASLIGRIKYAGQVSFKGDLVHWLKVEAYDTVIKPPVQDIHTLMVETAIEEALDKKVCKVCDGVGHLPEIDKDGRLTGAQMVCPDECKDGRVYWTDNARSKACGVHRDTWARHYNRLYTEILTIPLGWEGELSKAMS